MNMKQIYMLVVLFLFPALTKAAGLVSCEPKVVAGKIVNECGFCQAGVLIKNVTDWLGMVSGFVVVLIIIYAGLKMVYSVGNVSAKTDARRLISTAVIGYMIVLGAWILVDTLLKFAIPGSSYGINNPLFCP